MRAAAWWKEWYLQSSAAALWLRLALWLGFALFFLAAYQQYQEIAPQLAQLENRRGATQMLLVPVHQFLLHLMLLWAVFFGARALAQEFEWQTLSFRLGQTLALKAAVLYANLLLLTLPFWLSVAYLALGSDWDRGLLYGLAAAQFGFAAYLVALMWALAACLRHSVTTALAAAVLLLLLWLAPLLLHEPPLLANMLQWLSPFSHIALLNQGIFHVQTAIFALLHAGFLMSCVILAQQERG